MSTRNDEAFLRCKEKYGELTCKMDRYVQHGILPSEKCKEKDEVIEVPVSAIAERIPSHRHFSLLAFIFDFLTVGVAHWDYR